MTLDDYRPPLRGSISVGRTVETGRFQFRRVELMSEFWLDLSTHREEYQKLTVELDRLLTGRWRTEVGAK